MNLRHGTRAQKSPTVATSLVPRRRERVVVVVVDEVADLGAEHHVEQQVSFEALEVGPAEDEFHVQAEPPGRRRGHRRVVRLRPTDRHQDVGACVDRFGKVVLQLARLVPAEGEPGLVVALDQQARETCVCGKPRRGFDRSREIHQPQPFDRIEPANQVSHDRSIMEEPARGTRGSSTHSSNGRCPEPKHSRRLARPELPSADEPAKEHQDL